MSKQRFLFLALAVGAILCHRRALAQGTQSQQVASQAATITYGGSFTPTISNVGGGSGNFQWCVAGKTNYDGGASLYTGTNLGPSPGSSPGADWVPSWTPPGTGTYWFYPAADYNNTFAAANPGIGYELTVNSAPQASVSSEAWTMFDWSLYSGSSFTPQYYGGSGTGGWQFCIAGQTNWSPGVGQPSGTQLSSGVWTPSWGPSYGGHYTFYVAKNGDSNYLTSNYSGPWDLWVYAPVDGITWNSSPGTLQGTAGQSIGFQVQVNNSGQTTWDSNYYIVCWDEHGTAVCYASISGVSANGNASPWISFTLPSTPGNHTYTMQALNNGVGYFGSVQNFTVNVSAGSPTITYGGFSDTVQNWPNKMEQGDTGQFFGTASPGISGGTISAVVGYIDAGTEIGEASLSGSNWTLNLPGSWSQGLSAGSHNIWFIATDSYGNTAAIYNNTITVIGPLPVITSSLTANGTVGNPFSYTIEASNGVSSFSASGLPGGLSCDPSTGIISGTATFNCSDGVTIGATNAYGTTYATLTLNISTITTFALSQSTFTYTGAPQSPTVSPTPSGATFAVTSGTASAINAGNYSFVVTANGNFTGSQSLNWVINQAPPPAVSLTASSTSILPGSSPVTFTASGGQNGYVWSVSPAGPQGISGTGSTQSITFPSSSGSPYTVSVYSPAGNNYGQSNVATVNISVGPVAPPTVTITPTSSSPHGNDSVTFTAAGGTNGYVWSVSPSGPTGIFGNGATQTITFPAAGPYTVNVYSPAGGRYAQSNTATSTETVDLDSNGDGIPDWWEDEVYGSDQIPAGFANETISPGVTTTYADEYNSWGALLNGGPSGAPPWLSLQTDMVVSVLAKGTGSVTLTVAGVIGSTGGSEKFNFTGNSSTWSLDPSTEWDILADVGTPYTFTVTASGVTDYVVRVQLDPASVPYQQAQMTLASGTNPPTYTDTILKSQIIGDSFTAEMLPGGVLPFATMDASKLEVNRVAEFGLGSSSSGQTPGRIVFSAPSTIYYSGATVNNEKFLLHNVSGGIISIIQGPAMIWSHETATHFQGEAPSGYVDVSLTRYHWLVQYYAAVEQGTYPNGSDFNDLSDASPIATYDIALNSGGYTITRTAGGISLMYEQQATSQNTYPEGDPILGVDGSPDEYDYTATGTVLSWGWRTPGAPRGGLTETVYTMKHTELINGTMPQYPAFQEIYNPIAVAITRYA
ncbi:MAG: putative Ig domain-containing protein, partial [Candidatus Acidiferrales bacterium]